MHSLFLVYLVYPPHCKFSMVLKCLSIPQFPISLSKVLLTLISPANEYYFTTTNEFYCGW